MGVHVKRVRESMIKKDTKKRKMPNKNYRAGYLLELSTKKKWEEKGFYVIRSAGSHGIADLVALCSGSSGNPLVYLIQCKTKGKISLSDRHNLKMTADSLGATAVLVYRDEKNKYTEEWLICE